MENLDQFLKERGAFLKPTVPAFEENDEKKGQKNRRGRKKLPVYRFSVFLTINKLVELKTFPGNRFCIYCKDVVNVDQIDYALDAKIRKKIYRVVTTDFKVEYSYSLQDDVLWIDRGETFDILQKGIIGYASSLNNILNPYRGCSLWDTPYGQDLSPMKIYGVKLYQKLPKTKFSEYFKK